jgi:mono/diheme cytochrome c family protein
MSRNSSQHPTLNPCTNMKTSSNVEASSVEGTSSTAKARSNVEERRFSAASSPRNGCHPERSEGPRFPEYDPSCRYRLHSARTTVEERRFSAALSVADDAGFSPRGRTLHASAAIALLALTSIAQAQNPAAATLPPGPMQAKATTTCLECHEARIILQQRLSKPAWGKEVDKMTKWGAVLDPADRDALIDYLSTNFSPDKPPYDPPRTATDKSAPGKSSK